jgi:outer membrane protein assembly factor BamB
MILKAGVETFVVPTKAGSVYAIRADGTKAWDGTLASTELRAGNLYTPPGQPPGSALSTAYFAGTNGKLYAVIVDGQLDTGAPWPKAFHDARNTNDAGAPP